MNRFFENFHGVLDRREAVKLYLQPARRSQYLVGLGTGANVFSEIPPGRGAGRIHEGTLPWRGNLRSPLPAPIYSNSRLTLPAAS